MRPETFPRLSRVCRNRGALLVLAVVVTTAGLVAPAVAQTAAAPSTTAPALPRVPPPADLPRDRPLRAGFLLLDGTRGAELAAAHDVLQRTVFHTRPGIETFTVSPDGGVVRTAEGLAIDARYSFADAPALDILVVPSAEHNLDSDLGNDALTAWLKKAAAPAKYVVSLGAGAFLLAKSGVLGGRLATTFGADQDAFAQMFPKQELRRDVSFVHDGPAITSIGGARSYDVALYLVDHLYGEEVAKKVAAGLVLPWPPGSPLDLPALVIRYREE
jgi:transcriptional regulator GlxA family with amidase domain